MVHNTPAPKLCVVLLHVALLFLVLLPSAALAGRPAPLRLSLVDGDVQVNFSDSDEWYPAAHNMPVRAGDRLWVPAESWAEVETGNGTVVRLDSGSLLEILDIDQDSLHCYLSRGQAYFNVRSPYRDGMVQVDTPSASLRIYQQAVFNVFLRSNGDTECSVYKGQVWAENRRGESRVKAGNLLLLSDLRAILGPLGPPYGWEQWNRERDDYQAARYADNSYLPEELRFFESDLARNGRWVNTRSYGYVWLPTTSLSSGWSPYRFGRWVWLGNDYVWIGREPWGWVPYHYGRWSFISTLGWCWVPPTREAVYWGPGYVGWVHTPDTIAWVPLAPGETYYGYGYYGPHSVDLVRININQVVIRKEYRHVRVRDGVTVLHRKEFLQGRHEQSRHRDNPFLGNPPSVGRPNLVPEKATRMPEVRQIEAASAPPPVRETDSDEARSQRRLVKDRGRSVFTPEAAASPLPVEISREQIPAEPGREATGPAVQPTINEAEPERKKEKVRSKPAPATPSAGSGRREQAAEEPPVSEDRRNQKEETRPAARKKASGRAGQERGASEPFAEPTPEPVNAVPVEVTPEASRQEAPPIPADSGESRPARERGENRRRPVEPEPVVLPAETPLPAAPPAENPFEEQGVRDGRKDNDARHRPPDVRHEQEADNAGDERRQEPRERGKKRKGDGEDTSGQEELPTDDTLLVPVQ